MGNSFLFPFSEDVLLGSGCFSSFQAGRFLRSFPLNISTKDFYRLQALASKFCLILCYIIFLFCGFCLGRDDY